MSPSRCRSLVPAVAALMPLLTVLCAAATPVATFETDSARLEIDSGGSLSRLARTGSNRELLAPGQPSPLIRLRMNGTWQSPGSARATGVSNRIELNFPGAQVEVGITPRPGHVSFEVLRVSGPGQADLVSWGPYPIAIGETVGEIVGVVRDRRDAVGIQALNAKTLGGSPGNENDLDVEFSADDPVHYPGLPDELRKGQHFRADTARPMPFGSVLQAYTRQRDRERTIPNWGHPAYRVAPFDDGGLVGSRIALFACDEPRALQRIGEIELAEGLPHPMLDGEWAKLAPAASASYLIVDFGEANIDRAIEMTRRAGLRYLYHSSPFAKWGHFELKPGLFPNGWPGFRACVEKARRAGVDLGIHTLSNFITPSDAYVTPNPDPRLAVIGEDTLAAEVAADAREILVSSPVLFTNKSTFNAVRIGNELVRFARVSGEAPWRLLECQRGAWGTTPTSHPAGTRVGRLLDHPYNVLFSDAGLSLEIARNIAAFCNRTGARQISFDGLEGNWASGYGQYGRALFTLAWHEALDPGLRGAVINDASNPSHFNWHINTRMNWGEPWYAGFRESQTLYRFKNQLIFERNLMPHMLGWFALRADTSLEDAEWLLARAAGFNAGFALATSLASTAQLEADPDSADTSRRFGATAAILAAISRWETARLSGAFTPGLRAALRDNTREFQLADAGPGRWELREAQVARFEHPGTNTTSTFRLDARTPAQPVRWILKSGAKEPSSGWRLEIGGRTVLAPGTNAVPAGGSIRHLGGAEAVVCDAALKEIARIPLPDEARRALEGTLEIRLSTATPVRLETRLLHPAIPIQATRPGSAR